MLKKPRTFSIPCASGALIFLFMLSFVASVGATPGRAVELVFTAADTNHDNLVSVQEYHQAMQKRFEQLDVNRDGNLSRQEMEKQRATARQRLQALRGSNLSR